MYNTILDNNTILDYQNEFPKSKIVAIDNNSKDNTKSEIERVLRPQRDVYLFEPRQGKGRALRKGFSRIDADIYIVTDGDMTYAAKDANKCLKLLLENRSDLVTGDRISTGKYDAQNQRFGHSIGNRILTSFVSLMANKRYTDVMTGLRILPRPFIKALGVKSSGFQVETEMNLVAAYLGCDITEVPINYDNRPEGSESKLNSISDGIKIVRFATLHWILFKPLQAFGLFSVLSLVAGLTILSRAVFDYMVSNTLTLAYTGTFAFSAALTTIAVMSAVTGMIIHSSVSINKRRDTANYLENMRQWNARLDE